MRKIGRLSVPVPHKHFVFLHILILFAQFDRVEPRKHLADLEHHRVWTIPFEDEETAASSQLLLSTDMHSEPGISSKSSSLPTILSRKNRDIKDVVVNPKYEVSPEKPIHILFPLPAEKGRVEVNPFGITIDLARPVVDEALEEVWRRQYIQKGSFRIYFEDSKLSDAHGPNVAIIQLVKNKLDCIIGMLINEKTFFYNHF